MNVSARDVVMIVLNMTREIGAIRDRFAGPEKS